MIICYFDLNIKIMNTMIWVISNNTNEIIIKSACMWFRDRTSRENHIIICILLMAPHSGTLAWKIPWMEDPGRLQSMGLLRVRHDWANSVSLSTFMHWRRKWQPTPVFLPGESQGRGRLVGCCLWGHTESDMTEVT